ncbi:MAG: rRNA maturation RNase YbeY [Clostridiales bacterium]|nr:rRNA maturation RNase YbeY [Clostridiales bacterium]
MLRCTNSTFDHICCHVYNYLNLRGDDLIVELDIVDTQTIHEINLTHRAIDKPTDVLSFGLLQLSPQDTLIDRQQYVYEYSTEYQAILLGSIVVCQQIAKKQANEYGHSVEIELNYLFLHGLLHLLGYDHINNVDKILMRQVEKSIIKQINSEQQPQ